MRDYNERDSSELIKISPAISRFRDANARIDIAHVRAASATPTSAATIPYSSELASIFTIRGAATIRVNTVIDALTRRNCNA